MAKKIKNIFVQGPISPEFIGESIAHHSKKTGIGGHSIFLGQVRADKKEGNQEVEAIEYSSYLEMALEKAHEIREQTFEKYDLSCMHIHHSMGRVEKGEICLFVFTSSKHREPAINACNELVERIKKEIPIWGKEILSNKETNWKTNS
ncbi:MAG: molybdenum cofactor biosynthesis protein MoaE [Saprospirales bacterium]|nr:MAG: molybdenum cofactor biosynthesis protein MoaE [Saprospirales bacterium]